MSNSRRNRRARERMKARGGRDGIPDDIQLMKMAELISLGTILNHIDRTGPTDHTLNGTPRDDMRESREAAPSRPEPPPPEPDQAETESRKQAFKSLVAEFVADLRTRCLAQTGREDRYVSRGMTYRWKLIQDETPRKSIIMIHKVVDDEFIRSGSVEMNSTGSITVGPAPLRAMSETLREAREARAATAPQQPPPLSDTPPTMAFTDYHLIAMRNACSYMRQNLLWLGDSPDGDRIKVLTECVDMIDAGLKAIGR
jgi:hypothetical protein